MLNSTAWNILQIGYKKRQPWHNKKFSGLIEKKMHDSRWEKLLFGSWELND